MAIELVRDRRSKTPAPEETVDVYETMRAHGIICSKSGLHKNVLRMVPPLCIAGDDVDFFADVLATSFRQRFGS